MPLRCSDVPGRATHFGSGLRAHSTACSASERKPLVIVSVTPSARAAASMRSKAERDVRAHRDALAVRERAAVAAALGEGRRRGRGELGLGVRR